MLACDPWKEHTTDESAATWSPHPPQLFLAPSSSSATNDYSESRSEWTRILDRYGSRLVMNKLVTVWHVVSTRVLFFETVSYPIYIYIYMQNVQDCYIH